MTNNTGYIASNNDHTISLGSAEDPGRANVYLITLGVLACVYFLQSSLAESKTFKAPFVGFRSTWEPKFLVGLRFSNGALAHVTEGYNKVCNRQQKMYMPELVSDGSQFKAGLLENGMFKIARNDADILVISNKYVDELRSLPDEKLSAIRAHIKVNTSKSDSS